MRTIIGLLALPAAALAACAEPEGPAGDAGQIQVTTVTTGVDLPSGYDVSVDGGPPLRIGANATETSPVVSAGSHNVQLDHVASNCRASGGNPRAVEVKAGEAALVTFEVACQALGRIAYTYTVTWWNDDSESWEVHSWIHVMNEDGGMKHFVAHGSEPAWSPDGAQIAFNCVVESGNWDICVVNADGTGPVRLTSDTALDALPAWSPDGSKIAFVSDRDGAARRLYVMDADGTGAVRLTDGTAGGPAWSPDGARIAFDCVVESGNWDICVTNADGTGLVRLTSDPALDAFPAWSPDGAKIAFGTMRYGDPELAVMRPDGTGVSRARPGTWGTDPAWSPDGAKIAFQSHLYGDRFEIYVMNADGTGLVRLASGTRPAWSPAAP